MSAPATAPAAPIAPIAPGPARPVAPMVSSDAVRTLRVLLATALAVVPLLQMVSDLEWLTDAWIGMAIILLPAAALRLRWTATTVQLLPGFVLLIFYLTRRYLSEHAWGGFIPTRASWDDVRALSTDLGHTVANSVAPIQSTAAARLFLTAGLAVLALLIDLIAIELRRPALTGVPFLVLFAVAGAIPRHAVNWVWFAVGAIGYLLILSMDAQDALPTWGRVIERRGSHSSITRAFSGRRIGVAAVVIAVLVPLIIPLRSHDVLADALHNGRAGTGGDGSGSGGVRLDPLAALKGQLTKSKPITLFTVTVKGSSSSTAPYYLRSTPLDDYTGTAWVPGTDGSTGPLARAPFGRGTSSGTTTDFEATITIDKLAGAAPVFAAPKSIAGLTGSWTWSTQGQNLNGNVHSGEQYTETVTQPDPSDGELETAAAASNRGDVDELALPSGVPATVRTLVAGIVAGKSSAYEKARAISDYFHDPANGFAYSLQTKGGESGSELVDFLNSRPATASSTPPPPP